MYINILNSHIYYDHNFLKEFVIEPAIAPLSSIEIIKNRAMEMSDSPNIMSTSLVNEMMLCAKFDDMRVAKKVYNFFIFELIEKQ